MKWVALLQVSDLLLDVLTAFVALYMVDVVHASPSWAAAAVAIRTAAGLAGEAVLIPILGRRSGTTVLVGGTVAAVVAYPAFLLVPGLVPKLVALVVLSVATAPWYPLMQARLYTVVDGESAVAVTLNSAAGLVGGLAPLALGLAAARFGLAWSMAGLAAVPVAVLAGLAWPSAGSG